MNKEFFQGEISAEKLRAEIVRRLSGRTEEATRRAAELDGMIANLSRSIEETEKEKEAAEEKLARLSGDRLAAADSRKVMAKIEQGQSRLDDLQKKLQEGRLQLESLRRERRETLRALKSREVVRVLEEIKAPIRQRIEAEAQKLLDLMTQAEQAMEACRLVDRYVPDLNEYPELVPHSPYKGHFPQKELARYLQKAL